jgi:mono/diheme cytochrome c family protein
MSDRTTLGDRGRFRSRIGVWSRNALQVYKLAIARLPKPIDLLVIASLALLVAASAMFALLLSGPMPGGQEGYPLANSQSFERIQRGRYLVILADCAPVVSDSGIMRAGSAIYKDSCAAYHKDSGAGESDLFPRLARSALVQSDDATTLIRVVLQGSRGAFTSSKPTAPAMPAVDWRLNDAQAASVLAYIRNSWGNAATPVVARAVASQRSGFARLP